MARLGKNNNNKNNKKKKGRSLLGTMANNGRGPNVLISELDQGDEDESEYMLPSSSQSKASSSFKNSSKSNRHRKNKLRASQEDNDNNNSSSSSSSSSVAKMLKLLFLLLVLMGVGGFVLVFSELSTTIRGSEGTSGSGSGSGKRGVDTVVMKPPKEDFHAQTAGDEGIAYADIQIPASSQQPLLPPLIIGAGQGTTGTRTLHEAMCYLGIPSVHYLADCAAHTKKVKDNNTTPDLNFSLYDSFHYKKKPVVTLFLNRQQVQAVIDEKDSMKKIPGQHSDPHHPHIQLLKKMKHMHSCLRTTTSKTERNVTITEQQCTHPGDTDDMARWAEDYKALIDDTIRWRDQDDDGNDPIRNVGAIHDSPYTCVLPYIVAAAKRLRGQPPMILLTERPPDSWVTRRIEKHGGGLIYCRRDLLLAGSGANNESKSNNPHTSHFDWLECIDRTIRDKEESREGAAGKVKVHVHEVFIFHKHLLKEKKWHREELESHLMIAFEKHQKEWSDRSNMHWNMFQDVQYSTKEIAMRAHTLFSSSGAFEISKKGLVPGGGGEDGERVKDPYLVREWVINHPQYKKKNNNNNNK